MPVYLEAGGLHTPADPDPRGHIVYPYTDETQVADAVCLFASAGLRKGEAVLLVMTSDQCEPIRQRLQEQGFNLKEMETTGQLVCKDARDLLSTFLFDGIIDEHRFKTNIGAMIENAKSGGSPKTRTGRGGWLPMVDLIWEASPQPPQRLEELWDQVIEAHSAPLLCAYSLAGTKPSRFPASLLACHSHNIEEAA